MLKIKVCGMRSTENIAAIELLSPDFVGFIYYPSSKRFVGYDFIPPKMQTKKVGVFVDATIEIIEKASKTATLDFIQLHGNESVTLCTELKQKGYKIIKAFGINDFIDYSLIEQFVPYCAYFLFDTSGPSMGGTGKKFDWSLLKDYPFTNPFFLSGGIDLEDAEEISKITHPYLYGIDINSKFEISAGLKDAQRVKSFLKQLKINL